MQTATQTEHRRNGDANGEADVLEHVLQKTEARASERTDLMQMRMEGELIMAECRARPRDFEAIKRDLIGQLKAFPELADRSIYNKPVGQGKYARGLSIRAAEVLAEAYGYCRVGADVTPIDEDTVKVSATFMDYQRCRVWQDAGVLSRWYKARGGRMERVADDRFYGLTCKAEISRREREVILRSVNAGLKAWYEAECEKVVSSKLTDDAIAKIFDQFARRDQRLTQDILERIVGHTVKLGWTKTDRLKLVGVWNALADDETTVEELLRNVSEDATSKPAPQQPAAAAAATTVADLTSPKEVAKPVETQADVQEPIQDELHRQDAFDQLMDKIRTAQAVIDVNNAVAEAYKLKLSKDQGKKLNEAVNAARERLAKSNGKK